jgi:hypothetical protein
MFNVYTCLLICYDGLKNNHLVDIIARYKYSLSSPSCFSFEYHITKKLMCVYMHTHSQSVVRFTGFTILYQLILETLTEREAVKVY